MDEKKKICGDCKKYVWASAAGLSEGVCVETNNDVKYFDDATKCTYYEELVDKVTETAEIDYHPDQRYY